MYQYLYDTIYGRPEHWHLTSDNVQQKIELYPTKAASHRKKLSRLKFLCSFFYIQNRKICLSKTTLYQYSVGFFALLETVCPLKAFYMSLHSTKQKT